MNRACGNIPNAAFYSVAIAWIAALSGCGLAPGVGTDQDVGQRIPGPVGSQGAAGPAGPVGASGPPGLLCWDINGNGIGDAAEDMNSDGEFDSRDCVGHAGEDGLDGDAGSVGPAGPPGSPGAPGQDAATFIVSTVPELRAALEDLPPAGGRIGVRAGTYLVASTIDVNRDNVIIEGEGTATTFVLADGANCPVFVMGEPTPFQPELTHSNIVLRNIMIDGKRNNQTSELCTVTGREHLRSNCITLRGVTNCTVENVTLVGARSGGIVLEQNCDNILLRRITTSDNSFDGIAWDGVITNSVISDCTSRNNLAAGLSFDIGPEGNLVVDSIISDNGSVGIFMRDSRRNLFANCLISGNGEDGVFIADGEAPGAAASENYFDANLFIDNGRNGIWQAGASSVNNVVDGGLFCGNGMNAIEESFPSTAPLIVFDMTACP